MYQMDPATQRKWQAHCRGLARAVDPQETVTIARTANGQHSVIQTWDGHPPIERPNWQSNGHFASASAAADYARSLGYRVEEA